MCCLVLLTLLRVGFALGRWRFAFVAGASRWRWRVRFALARTRVAQPSAELGA
jgi:hypothetical protein